MAINDSVTSKLRPAKAPGQREPEGCSPALLISEWGLEVVFPLITLNPNALVSPKPQPSLNFMSMATLLVQPSSYVLVPSYLL